MILNDLDHDKGIWSVQRVRENRPRLHFTHERPKQKEAWLVTGALFSFGAVRFGAVLNRTAPYDFAFNIPHRTAPHRAIFPSTKPHRTAPHPRTLNNEKKTHRTASHDSKTSNSHRTAPFHSHKEDLRTFKIKQFATVRFGFDRFRPHRTAPHRTAPHRTILRIKSVPHGTARHGTAP